MWIRSPKKRLSLSLAPHRWWIENNRERAHATPGLGREEHPTAIDVRSPVAGGDGGRASGLPQCRAHRLIPGKHLRK
eukprot:11168827-Lingulodinium_polyedra.AAC.1